MLLLNLLIDMPQLIYDVAGKYLLQREIANLIEKYAF